MQHTAVAHVYSFTQHDIHGCVACRVVRTHTDRPHALALRVHLAGVAVDDYKALFHIMPPLRNSG